MKEGSLIFTLLLCLLLLLAACKSNKRISAETTTEQTMTTTTETMTIATTQTITQAATTTTTATKTIPKATTTRTNPQEIISVVQKNANTLLQNMSIQEKYAESTAKTLYSLGVSEIKEITYTEEPLQTLFTYPSDWPSSTTFYSVRIVDSENKVYCLTMDLDGYLAQVYQGEIEERNHIYIRK